MCPNRTERDQDVTKPKIFRSLDMIPGTILRLFYLYCVMITASDSTASLSAFRSTLAWDVARIAISKFSSVMFITQRKKIRRTTPAPAIGAPSNTCGTGSGGGMRPLGEGGEA